MSAENERSASGAPGMRVLHVVATDRRRGAETFTADLVRPLREGGVQQRVSVLRPGAAGAVHFDVPTESLGDGWRVPGIRLGTGALRDLRSLVASWKPDVIQVSGGEPLKHVMAAAGGLAPVIYRRIGSARGRDLGWLSQQAYAWLMRRSARVVAVAQSIRRETIERFRVPPERVVVIPKGIDADRLRPTQGRRRTRRRLAIGRATPVVASVGALTWEKDPVGHLEVMGLVRRAVPDAVHLVVGEGPLGRAVAAAAATLDPNGRTLLLGSREDVGDLLAASDVVLLASRSEGLPGCLMEAGMAGLPSAAYALAGVPEVVVDGQTGLLAPPGDREALASAVTHLLREARMRESLGRAARERCVSRFEIGGVARAYLALYRELAG